MTTSVPELPVSKWPSQYVCFWCKKRTKAVVRIFSGIYADGWPGCAKHAINAQTKALEPLARTGPYPIADGYEVRAYEVVIGDDGYPDIGRTLWLARSKSAQPSASP